LDPPPPDPGRPEAAADGLLLGAALDVLLVEAAADALVELECSML
jgi:hypothetical protein